MPVLCIPGYFGIILCMLNIRPEIEEDFPFIYGLIKTAFETAARSSGTEQDFAAKLRSPFTYV